MASPIERQINRILSSTIRALVAAERFLKLDQPWQPPQRHCLPEQCKFQIH
jgi:hypothetical protein